MQVDQDASYIYAANQQSLQPYIIEHECYLNMNVTGIRYIFSSLNITYVICIHTSYNMQHDPKQLLSKLFE